MKKATGKANGKIIIMGEHAVVHGYPSVALPFHAVEMTVTIEQ
ncbi:mevalonate kinase, partial [Aerococcus urinaeequi]